MNDESNLEELMRAYVEKYGWEKLEDALLIEGGFKLVEVSRVFVNKEGAKLTLTEGKSNKPDVSNFPDCGCGGTFRLFCESGGEDFYRRIYQCNNCLWFYIKDESDAEPDEIMLRNPVTNEFVEP